MPGYVIECCLENKLVAPIKSRFVCCNYFINTNTTPQFLSFLSAYPCTVDSVIFLLQYKLLPHYAWIIYCSQWAKNIILACDVSGKYKKHVLQSRYYSETAQRTRIWQTLMQVMRTVYCYNYAASEVCQLIYARSYKIEWHKIDVLFSCELV